MDFSGKNVIVTGGAAGIGRAVAEGIVAGGGTVIITDINMEAADKAKRELDASVCVCQMDIGDARQTRAAIAGIIKKSGRIHAAVNCAGIISTKKFGELGQEEWERVIRVNLTGAYTVTSALFSHMADNGGGRIVNVSSVAGKIGGGLLGTAAYAASKAGINGLTKAVAREGGPFGICCNAVCPSYTNTDMTKTLSEDPVRNQIVINAIPLRRRAEPQEIANMILFFASDLASFVNGEIGDVDGGLTMDG